MYTVTTNKPILNGTNRSYMSTFLLNWEQFFHGLIYVTVLFDYADL